MGHLRSAFHLSQPFSRTSSDESELGHISPVGIDLLTHAHGIDVSGSQPAMFRLGFDLSPFRREVLSVSLRRRRWAVAVRCLPPVVLCYLLHLTDTAARHTEDHCDNNQPYL